MVRLCTGVCLLVLAALVLCRNECNVGNTLSVSFDDDELMRMCT